MDPAGRSASAGGSRPHTRPGENRVKRLRNRLVLIFLAATLAPLAATIWFTASLLEPTGLIRATAEIDALSQTLLRTSQEFYNRACDDLKQQAQAGGAQPHKYRSEEH